MTTDKIDVKPSAADIELAQLRGACAALVAAAQLTAPLLGEYAAIRKDCRLAFDATMSALASAQVVMGK